jgi:hypothetical protein
MRFTRVTFELPASQPENRTGLKQVDHDKLVAKLLKLGAKNVDIRAVVDESRKG